MTINKHLDWNRIGKTILIPLIILGCVFIPYWIGNCYNNVPHIKDFIYFKDDTGTSAVNLMRWLVGIGNILAPILTFLIIGNIVEIFIYLKKKTSKVINYYYHNGRE